MFYLREVAKNYRDLITLYNAAYIGEILYYPPTFYKRFSLQKMAADYTNPVIII